MTEQQTKNSWYEADKAHHIHPFMDPSYFDTKKVRVITKAEGSYIYDAEGNKILDGMAGLWCVNVGYGRQELVDAATKQMEQVPYYNNFFQTALPSQIELAAKLAELTPAGLDHFFYANSGSEANDTVIRLARHYWATKGQPEKRIFIGRDLAYHGSTLAATSLGGMAPMRAMGGSILPEFEHIMEPHYYAHGDGMTPEEFGLKAARALEDKILELGADKVAAFIGEPIQGAGGVIDPPSTYWPEIQRICRKYDILLVADEVICGFGRLGTWFGSDVYGIEPDLMPMAKGMSSGYLPIAAVAVHKKVYDVLHNGGPILHGYTYSGHPTACAVALANIELIEKEGLIDKVRDDTAPYFRKALNEEIATHPIVGEVRGAGLVAAIQLVKDKGNKTVFTGADGAGIICREHLADNNLIMRAVDQSMVTSPPLVITHAEIDELIEKTKAGLDHTAKHFGIV